MAHVFLYGTLLDLDLLEIVLGRKFAHRPATLDGYRAAWVAGADYPMIEVETGRAADGIVLENVSQTDIDRLDFYEGPYGYALGETEVLADGETIPALTYFPEPGKLQAGEDWDIDAWAARYGALQREAAIEIMSRFGVIDAWDVAKRVHVINARAQATLNAKSSPSSRVLRVPMDADRIEVKASQRDHDNWFLTEEFRLQHPKYDGSDSADILRAVFVMADAVTVLPYDPVRDCVMLIEQFRAGIYRRGDPHPWSLEVIAGRIDAHETPQDAAHREAMEETGLHLKALHKISSYYASPGATTEYLTSFVGLADLPEDAAGIGGLLSEDEDIRALIVPFEALMDALESGEAENGPLIVSAFGLARMRDRLRAGG